MSNGLPRGQFILMLLNLFQLTPVGYNQSHIMWETSEKMHLKVVEPCVFCSKIGKRVGKALGLPDSILKRHPFPGPGLQ